MGSTDRRRTRAPAGQPDACPSASAGAPGTGRTRDVCLLRSATREIDAMLAAGGTLPTLGTVAERLSVHPRTLQRRLRSAWSGFRTLLDARRMDRALQLLAHTREPAVVIAAQLGYSDAAHFARAFRRWTGKTPIRHRCEHALTPVAGAEAD